MKAIIVHGGAGNWKEEKLREAEEGLKEAVLKGFELLKKGKVVDACEEAVKVLEDNPLFNAGRGSVLNEKGEVELDASIMNGRTFQAGAVGSVKKVKNPISLARIVMEKTKHTLIVCEGAYKLALKNGLEISEELITEERLKQWKEGVKGTVGCVATDGKTVVVGTSTGGILLKKEGRVGDSAIIGAGTYANEFGGASATGDGDEIIKISLSFFVVNLISQGISPSEACRAGIDLLKNKTGGKGGVIALSKSGKIGYAHNTKAMPIAYLNSRMRKPKFRY